jgi:hypothetical protein
MNQIDATAELSAVTTTVASAEDAQRLAQAVLEHRLAACVQVEAVVSHYRAAKEVACDSNPWKARQPCSLQQTETVVLDGFHAFGDHGQAQQFGQHNDGVGNGRIVGVVQCVAHKALVDLDLVQRQALEVAQR